MSKFTPIKTAFNAGELSPLMYGRTDIDKYSAGCQEITNFIPLAQGAVTRRPGTRFVKEIKNSANRVWLQSFVFNKTQAFVIEFGPLYIRLYNNYNYISCGTPAAWNSSTAYDVSDLVSHGGINYYCTSDHINQSPPNTSYWYALTGDIYEIPTPYTANDLTTEDGTCALSMVQSGDVVYIAHRNHPPQKLSRFANTRWVFNPVKFSNGPFDSNNADQSIKVTISGLINYIGVDFEEYSVSLSATNDVFTASMVDTNLQLEVTDDPTIKPWVSQKSVAINDICRNDDRYYAVNIVLGSAKTGYVSPGHTRGGRYDGDEVSWWYLADQIGIVKIVSVADSQNAIGTVIRQVSNTGASSLALTSVTINPSGSGILTSSSDMIVTNNTSSGVLESPSDISSSGGHDIILTGGITPNYTSSSTTDSATSWAWSKSAWGSDVGYPSHVTFFRERLVFARDQKVWFSCAGDYENFAAKEFGEILADSAITLTVPFDQVSQIVYLMSTKTGLVVGSTDGEALISAGSQGEPFGPTNVRVDTTTFYGSRKLTPSKVDNAILFMQRTGRRLREIVYDFNTDNLVANDVSIMAEHMTMSGVIDMSFHREPYNVLWCVLANGQLVGFTYNRAQNVTGWHRHKLGGTFGDSGHGIVEAVQVIPSYDGSCDNLWMVVKRTINGVTRRYVEYLDKGFADGDSQDSCYYIDCGATYSGSATKTITGLNWLQNTGIAILANGAVHANKVVGDNGQAVLDYEVTVAQVGLPYTPMVTTMRIDGGSQAGTSQGKKKQITSVMLRLLNSGGVMIGSGKGTHPYTLVDQRNTNTPMGSPSPLMSGDFTETIDAPIDQDATLTVTSKVNYPITVIALSPVLEVFEK